MAASSRADRQQEGPGLNIDPASNRPVFDAVLEQVAALLWTVDADLCCRYISKPAPAGFGIEVQSGLEPAQAVAHRQALGGVVVYYEIACDGRRFSCRVGPVADVSGAVGGLVGSALEIDSSSSTQPSVAPPSAFPSMLEHAAEGLAILDAEGRFIFMNAAARRLADVEPIGTAITQGSAVWGEWVDSDGAPMRSEDWPLVRALRGDVTQGSEIRKVSGDGSSFHILFSAAPVRDASDAIIGAIASFTDITARKRTEEAMRAANDELETRVRARTAELRRSEEQLTAMIESSSDPIWSVDRDGKLTTFNTILVDLFRSLLGVEPEVGASILDYMPPEAAAPWRERIERACDGERFVVEESVRVGKTTRHFIVCFYPMEHDDGVREVTVFAKDVTELKRAEEQARQHQAELAHVLRVHTLGQMVASLAHEINQPLGAIANYAQGCRNWLQSGEAPSEKLLAAVEQIAAEALRAGEITRRVRDLLRKDRAKRLRVDPNAIVRNALAIVAPSARRSEVTLSLDATPELPHVRVDAIQIEQVLLNLLLNGIDAVAQTDGPREVSVRTRAERNRIEIAVADTGRGIDPADEEQLFEPFFTTKPSGLGMGLAISRSIVEAHDGRIWVARRDGRGACICVSLPTAAGPAR